MPRGRTPTLSLEEAKARFGEWRQNRRGKARIPAELWSAAVAVARKEGLNRTLGPNDRPLPPARLRGSPDRALTT